ncbi:hypothetical protein KC19_5G135500 [Ceratodon purpureus]|nr:hypothetical protein KC19_5G135500 [Ceratodon purpureus]KAG0577161.1 hypothetical protein KC19_5G135500 [Ceratodon purpureus]
MAERKRVVVVGGGVGGSLVAKNLESHADVTLIDPKEYYEVPYAQMRCIVEPSMAERSVLKHSEYLKTAHIVQSAAESVSGSEVVTESGERVPFDFLVITTGTTYSGPSTKAERVKLYEADKEKIVAADHVLVIGGGPVGVELVGEIVVDFPDKKVTLVHSGKRLLEFLGTKVSDKTLKWLQSKKNVEVILNDRIALEGLTGPEYVTKNGTHIKADAHFVCIGKRVGSSWLQSSDLSQLIDEEGRLKVDANMRLEGQSNIFAVGDIANTKEIKQGYLAGKQADVVVDNIKRLIKNSKAPKLAEYKPLTSPLGLVSLGRYEGVAQFPIVTLIGRLPGMLKSGDLFVGKARGSLGVK